MAFLVLLMASGCAPRAALKPVLSAPAPEPGVAAYIDFYRSPAEVTRPYRELELVTVLGWGRDREAMIDELKEKARALGAEGVIELIENDTREAGLNYSDARCEREAVLLRAIAIVYDEDPEVEDSGAAELRQPAGK